MIKIATIKFGNIELDCPVIEGSENELGIDISQLRSKTGLITVDNGFPNTSTGCSDITYLDGENGILRYRGIPIEELAEKSNFLEVAYLLIFGQLPTESEYKE